MGGCEAQLKGFVVVTEFDLRHQRWPTRVFQRNGRVFMLIGPHEPGEYDWKTLNANGYHGEIWYVYHFDDKRMTAAFFGRFKEKDVIYGAFSDPMPTWCQRRRRWVLPEKSASR